MGVQPLPALERISPIPPCVSIFLKSDHQVVFIVCRAIERTTDHEVEFGSEKCKRPAAVCMQSNEQFVSLQKILLAIRNTQFNASAFIGNPTIQNKEKDIRLKDFVSVYHEYSLTLFIVGHLIVGWFTAFYTVSLR
jgi:hypothetical protein